MRSFFFFKDSYFATATAVIINVHFSITCLPLSYSSPSTTLCIITVTHRKSGVGLGVRVRARAKAECVYANACVGAGGVGVLSSVHQKLKPVRLPYLPMEPPDVIAANPHHVIWLSSTVHNPSPFSHLTNRINQSLSTTTPSPRAILCCTPHQPPHVMFSIDNILLSHAHRSGDRRRFWPVSGVFTSFITSNRAPPPNQNKCTSQLSKKVPSTKVLFIFVH